MRMKTGAEFRAAYVKSLDEDMGVPDAETRRCYLVVHDGAVTIVETDKATLDLQDLYSAPSKVGAEDIATVGHLCLGETHEGRKIDLWFDDDGIADERRKACMALRGRCVTICGPVVVTSSDELGNTVPLPLADGVAIACSAGGGGWIVFPRGIEIRKPKPSFAVQSFDRDEDSDETVNPN